jgi:hypothetical protein
MKPETLGVARDDADVGGEHEVEPCAHSAAADRGDELLRHRNCERVPSIGRG